MRVPKEYTKLIADVLGITEEEYERQLNEQIENYKRNPIKKHSKVEYPD